MEHDAVRNRFGLFGIVPWNRKRRCAVETGRETVARGHQPDG
jgi:hypothetical protein